MKIKKEQTLYVRSMGKALKVTAMFYNEDPDALTKEINSYSEKHRDEGLVSIINDFALMAHMYDHGVKIG